jgi:hypothetical protein
MRRLVLWAAVVAAASAAGQARFEPSPAGAAPGLVVGVDDDTLKWSWPGWRFIAAYEGLQLQAIRVTLHWRPGEVGLGRLERLYLERVTTALMRGNRVVLSIFGKPRSAPATPEDRERYCAFVVDALHSAPSIRDVVIWNEVNSPRFWRPAGEPAAAAYVALLARCYDDVRKSFRRPVNLISSTAPRHDPGGFIAKLGAAYRASARDARIFDTFGHNPYPATNAEPPWAQHPGSRMLGQGDYGALMDALTNAFGGTAQPVPGEAGVKVWYLENGFETEVPDAHIGRYHGREVASTVIQPVERPRPASPVRDQASQLRDALELAYCQPAVGAFFNFQLVDEVGLAGWQSGLLWAGGARKPSYAPFRKAIEDVADRNVDCSRFPAATLGLSRAIPALPLLSSPACCELSSSTSTSRSPGLGRTSDRTATGSSASATASTSTRPGTSRRARPPSPR